MSVTSDICTYAFAALALLSSGQALAQPTATPTRAFPQLMVDVPRNSYYTNFSSLVGKGTSFNLFEIINCTTGTLTQSNDYSSHPSTAPISVMSLSMKAQEMIRANCNSHGLRAGF